MRIILIPAALILALLTGCGPEAETGAVFGRHHEQASAKTVGQAVSDTIIPNRHQQAEKSADDSPASGVPSGAGNSTEINYLFGKFEPAGRPDFAPVGKPYTAKPGMYLRREALAAFQKMYTAARKDGIVLNIISATRTFEQQKTIWNNKWARFAAETPDPEARSRRILEYSAMPGASRHHWGTDVDLNDLNNASFEKGGRYEKVYIWLKAHAREYGFCQPYTTKDDTRPNGYNEERWHWSYMPVAGALLREYGQITHDDMFEGFQGANSARAIGIVKNYALGINPDCR